jgi:DNA-binding NarL/FixJ family response regulator
MRDALWAAIDAEPDLDILRPSTSGNAPIKIMVSSQPDVLYLPAQPDIILLDLENAGADDLRALSDLHLLLPETPILALASTEASAQEQVIREAGAEAVLVKSALRSEILQALREIGSLSKSNPTARLSSPEIIKESKRKDIENSPSPSGAPVAGCAPASPHI